MSMNEIVKKYEAEDVCNRNNLIELNKYHEKNKFEGGHIEYLEHHFQVKEFEWLQMKELCEKCIGDCNKLLGILKLLT